MSKGKKWTIALAVIVLIAVVAVILIVCLPKNVNDVKNRAFAEQETSFLNDKDEAAMYSSFESKIAVSAPQYRTEASDAKTVSLMMGQILGFYNNYLVYAENNGTFQSQYRVILDGFNSMNTYQKGMKDILKDVNDYVGQDANTYITGAWQKFKVQYNGYVSSYAKTLEGLGKVFIDCVPKGVQNNDFTKLVIETTNDYLTVIAKHAENNSAVVSYASRFVSRYLIDTDTTFKFEFNESMKTSLNKINEFTTVYKDNIISVIESIDASGIKYQQQDIDQTNILSTVKSFLNGGITA